MTSTEDTMTIVEALGKIMYDLREDATKAKGVPSFFGYGIVQEMWEMAAESALDEPLILAGNLHTNDVIAGKSKVLDFKDLGWESRFQYTNDALYILAQLLKKVQQ